MLSQLVSDLLGHVHQIQPRSHLTPLVECLLLLVPACALGCGWLTRSRASTVLGGLAGCALAAALTLTLLRGTYGHGSLARVRQCAVTDPFALTSEGLANLALFAPAAFLVALAVGQPLLVACGVVIVSMSVEAIQAFEWIGVCDSSDVVRNTAGGLVAALAGAGMRTRWLLRGSAVSGSDACPRSC